MLLMIQGWKDIFYRPNTSYSQCGEDLIVNHIFESIGIRKPSYLDIGAHDPKHLNNTYSFYKNGSSGVNVEPDISLFNKLRKIRRKDLNLNIGVSDVSGDLDFYVMSSPTLNTFSRESAEKFVQEGYKIQSIQKVHVETISSILDKHFNGVFPEFLSIDIEGEEERVLRSIDYDNNGPLVICVETISFSNSGRGVKNKEVIDFLLSNGYIVYADTYINSIFVRRERWER